MERYTFAILFIIKYYDIVVPVNGHPLFINISDCISMLLKKICISCCNKIPVSPYFILWVWYHLNNIIQWIITVSIAVIPRNIRIIALQSLDNTCIQIVSIHTNQQTVVAILLVEKVFSVYKYVHSLNFYMFRYWINRGCVKLKNS